MKKRLLYYEISKYLKHKNALVITGMRQVGKTTLMKQIYDDLTDYSKLWFDFDNPLDQKTFEDIEYHNIHTRLRQMSAKKKNDRLFVFIDEIQNFPEITKIIKFLIDHYQIKFIVTGSSSFYLKNLFPESLSGRKFLYELSPLTFKEFLYFHNKISLEETMENSLKNALQKKSIIDVKKRYEEYVEYLNFGGFPEVVTTDDEEIKRRILKNIFGSFFEKDLKLLADYKDIRELRDLILLLAPRVGSMLDISKISSELSIDRGKTYHYLEFLQGTFFLRLLPKYSKSIDRSVAGGKKVYFTDTGLLRITGNLTDAQVLENGVINQLRQFGELSFYNKRNTAEIDIILNKEIAFEVKMRATTQDVKYTKKLASKLGLKKTYIISQNFVDHQGIIFPMFL